MNYNRLQVLKLAANKIGQGSINSIADFIYQNKSLLSLDLSGNKITDRDIVTLKSSLIGNVSIRDLNLSENQGITDISFKDIKEILMSSHIEFLDVSETRLSAASCKQIINLFKTPIQQREIPMISFTKSAAKSQF